MQIVKKKIKNNSRNFSLFFWEILEKNRGKQ